jgi:hypothetical protein
MKLSTRPFTFVAGLTAFAWGAACDGGSPLSAPLSDVTVVGESGGESAATTSTKRRVFTPIVLATAADQDSLAGIALGGGSVYFLGSRTVPRTDGTPGPASEMLGVLRRVPTGGGAVEQIWAGAGGGAQVALGGGDAIDFLTYDFFWRTGHLYRLPAGGEAAAAELATWSSHGSSHSLAVDGDTIYWTHSAGASSSVNRTSAVDGATTTLADSSTIGSSADHIVSKGGALFWSSTLTQPTVYQMPVAGGTPSALFSATDITALAADPTDAVLYVGADGNVTRLGLSEGESRVLATRPGRITAIAADDRTIYFGVWNADTATGELVRIARNGAPFPTVLTSGALDPVAIAVDATSIYWVDTASRTVAKAAK